MTKTNTMHYNFHSNNLNEGNFIITFNIDYSVIDLIHTNNSINIYV